MKSYLQLFCCESSTGTHANSAGSNAIVLVVAVVGGRRDIAQHDCSIFLLIHAKCVTHIFLRCALVAAAAGSTKQQAAISITHTKSRLVAFDVSFSCSRPRPQTYALNQSTHFHNG